MKDKLEIRKEDGYNVVYKNGKEIERHVDPNPPNPTRYTVKENGYAVTYEDGQEVHREQLVANLPKIQIIDTEIFESDDGIVDSNKTRIFFPMESPLCENLYTVISRHPDDLAQINEKQSPENNKRIVHDFL